MCRPARVEFVRAIAHADDAGFAGGAATAVGRAVSVEQRDARAAAAKVMGDPGAEGSGADDYEVVSLVHFDLSQARWPAVAKLSQNHPTSSLIADHCHQRSFECRPSGARSGSVLYPDLTVCHPILCNTGPSWGPRCWAQ